MLMLQLSLQYTVQHKRRSSSIKTAHAIYVTLLVLFNSQRSIQASESHT